MSVFAPPVRYFSPFPKEYQRVHMLYFCEFDLSFFARKEQLERYLKART